MATTNFSVTAGSARHRIRQGMSALRPVAVAEEAAISGARLTDEQAAAFRALSTFDRRHLCRVYEGLRAVGATDPDVLQAALLHDLGKCCRWGKVTLVHRVMRVVLARLAPSVLERLARLPAPRWRLGVALAARHPHLGAEQALALGCSHRTCWLIAHHEVRPVLDDPDLQLLVAMDERTP